MKRTLIIVGLLLVLVAMWWLLRQEPLGLPSQEKAAPKEPAKVAAALPPLTPEQKQQQTQTNPEKLAGFKAAFATPINLYGRVIDQHGDPVASANVEYSILSFENRPKGQLSSRADGTFQITGHRGASIAVWVSKDGYRRLPGVDGEVGSDHRFAFGSKHPPASSPQEPIVFTLQKPGVIEPLIHVEERNYRLPRDGSPTEIELHPGGNSAHRVVLRCWNKELEPRPQTEPRYDWRLEITAPGGGITERKDIMAFEAPETGYEPKAIIDMPVEAKPSWSRSAQRSYFIRFADNVFARVNVEMIAGGDHFVVWESHLNPKTGSRNLDTDPAQR
ncbi:hypothetical protein [Aestuariivirga sp.]|jgi:hypothetical protein|uniref:hypothetical protein n=1 Tax=Aestuariivirga sp. TaxID=2650926 RepID=UPI0037830F7F